MKLELTVPERPGLMQALPVCDILALLLVFLLMAPTFMTEEGVEVTLPSSQRQLSRFSNPIVLTMSAGEDPALFLAGEPVRLDELRARLDALLLEGRWQPGAVVLLKADVSSSVGRQMEVMDIIRAADLRCALAAKPLPETR